MSNHQEKHRSAARSLGTDSVYEPRGELAADMYWALKRRPLEGTASAAIQAHSQACGIVGWLLDWHPDRVARAVRDVAERRDA